MRGVLQLQICSLETATNKKIALVCLTEDVLRGCVQLSKHNTSEGQIGINKVIRAVEPTKQNATLGRARESLSTEEIFGGDVNEKRGPQKISGGGIQDRNQSKSGCSEERQPRVVEDGRRCGFLVTKVEMRQAEGTWEVRHLLWDRTLWT